MINAKMCFPQYLQNKWMNFVKFVYCALIYTRYKIHVVSNARDFWSLFNRVMALDRRQNFVFAQYLVN